MIVQQMQFEVFTSFNISQKLLNPKTIKATLPKRDIRTYKIKKLAYVSKSKQTINAVIPKNRYSASSDSRPVNNFPTASTLSGTVNQGLKKFRFYQIFLTVDLFIPLILHTAAASDRFESNNDSKITPITMTDKVMRKSKPEKSKMSKNKENTGNNEAEQQISTPHIVYKNKMGSTVSVTSLPAGKSSSGTKLQQKLQNARKFVIKDLSHPVKIDSRGCIRILWL